MVVLVIPVAVQAVDVDPTDFEGLALSEAIKLEMLRTHGQHAAVAVGQVFIGSLR